MADIEFRISRNMIPRISKTIVAEVDGAVRRTAMNIEAGAKARTPPRVDTGAMRAGWFTTTALSDGRDQAWADAQAQWPGKGAKTPKGRDAEELTEAEAPDPVDGPMQAVISNAVDYAFDNEMGTVRCGAHPMLGPAVDAEAAKFELLIAQAINRAAMGLP